MKLVFTHLLYVVNTWKPLRTHIHHICKCLHIQAGNTSVNTCRTTIFYILPYPSYDECDCETRKAISITCMNGFDAFCFGYLSFAAKPHCIRSGDSWYFYTKYDKKSTVFDRNIVNMRHFPARVRSIAGHITTITERRIKVAAAEN